jgi:hypothetical protein
MQWLFELSAACAISALAISPLIKLFFDAPQRSRRSSLKAIAFGTLVPIPVEVRAAPRGLRS